MIDYAVTLAEFDAECERNRQWDSDGFSWWWLYSTCNPDGMTRAEFELQALEREAAGRDLRRRAAAGDPAARAELAREIAEFEVAMERFAAERAAERNAR